MKTQSTDVDATSIQAIRWALLLFAPRWFGTLVLAPLDGQKDLSVGIGVLLQCVSVWLLRVSPD